MTNAAMSDFGHYFWHGGERLKIVEVPDRFTVRLKRGITPQTLAASYHTTYEGELTRQNLEEFTVDDAAELDTVMAEIRQGEEVQFASHVYALEEDPAARIYLTDEITVQFKPDVSDEEIERLTADLGLDLVKPLVGLPNTYVFRVTSQAKENPIKLSNRLMATDRVVVSEPNVAIASQTFYLPSDSLFSEQWHLNHTGGPFLSTNSHIDVARAWDITRGDRSIVVAVTDDSCDTRHIDFQGEGKIVFPRDFAGRDFDPLPEADDDNHGTACAGVAVAEENGQGVVGVAPGCALMPVRTSGFLDDNAIEALFTWVMDNGASVVSCSWGAASNYFPLSLRQQNAIQRAATQGRNGKGCVIVFAAGNANRPVNDTVNETGWPNDLYQGPTRWLAGYANHPEAIAVSACTSLAKKSAYSNWGKEISVCAPSNNAHPGTFHPSTGPTLTYPRITTALPGRGVVTTDRTGPSGYSSTDYTRNFGGTSSACPVVAGVAALVLSANPDLTAREVKAILESTADKITDAATDPQLGLALGTYDENGHSQWFGYGKVNAFKAVTEAVRRRTTSQGQVFQTVSAPALPIPDNNAIGVADTIPVSETATLSAIRVSVDITHPYIADLRIALISPMGTSVMLHDRNGGSTHNLQRTFDLTSTAGFSALMGQPIQGNWTLHIQDVAPQDVGQFNRWELQLEAAPETMVELAETPGAAIPDNDPHGIIQSLEAATAGFLKTIEVSVDITHTYIGDLGITLISPSGTQVALHERMGGSADHLITTFTPATTAGLQTLLGEPIQGQWRLRVADQAGMDVGKLNRWSLRLACKMI